MSYGAVMTKQIDNTLRVYFHGSWLPQSKEGGWAFLLTRRNNETKVERSSLKGLMKDTTQPAIELLAVCEAFRRINERKLADRPITVCTTSNYINQGINSWLDGWKAKGWKGANKKPIKNIELWQELDKWNQEFSPAWELITNEGNHPSSLEVKSIASSALNAISSGQEA